MLHLKHSEGCRVNVSGVTFTRQIKRVGGIVGVAGTSQIVAGTILHGRLGGMELVAQTQSGIEEAASRRGFLPYPASRLSPVIHPPDMNQFKSRGLTQVQRELFQQLEEMRRSYERVIDAFNWNKVVYESRFQFEPVIGDTYHLYRDDRGFFLSMIEPHSWGKKFVGSFRLGPDCRWIPEAVAPDFDLRELVADTT